MIVMPAIAWQLTGRGGIRAVGHVEGRAGDGRVGLPCALAGRHDVNGVPVGNAEAFSNVSNDLVGNVVGAVGDIVTDIAERVLCIILDIVQLVLDIVANVALEVVDDVT